MSDVKLLESMTVVCEEIAGSDRSIANAARVSLIGEPREDRNKGLINALMRQKHGSPFEHNMLRFYIKAPIFVFREFHRHRIGFSYNEMSGRYVELKPEFYVPPKDRPLVNAGTSMRPNYVAGSSEMVNKTHQVLKQSYQDSWNSYQQLLEAGVALEVARATLPVGIMSQMIVTCNVRSLLHFLSLRTHEPTAAFVSHPQAEIEMVAREMEGYVKKYFPYTYEAYCDHGRVAP